MKRDEVSSKFLEPARVLPSCSFAVGPVYFAHYPDRSELGREVVMMAQVRRVVRWRPVGAAATFLVAAIAGVVGNQLTGHLSVALVVFVGLLVVGAAVVFVLERFTGERTSGGDQDTNTAADLGKTYDLTGAQGVQVGDGNWQRNYFGPEPETAPNRPE